MEKESVTGISSVDLSGKWRYKEEYDYGNAEGELILEQQEGALLGRLIFIDKLEEEEKSYMLQEFVKGSVEGLKVNLQAYNVDIIDSERDVSYELDSWFGILVDNRTIKGISMDEQDVSGYFIFEKIN